ncbi:MAG: Endonuclease/exonuclease/phosphatase [Parcubacteria group bacterium GW2011_GWA2_45_30]|nr:MAG: Endonuclease/exonuclease/phosphatase [Parcubacteria group bacterium GW2011_GWA2_45_30]
MKLITLNIWGGKVYAPLMAFLKEHAEEVDIFCLQEVFNTSMEEEIPSEARIKIFSEIGSVLTSFTGFHAPITIGWDFTGKPESRPRNVQYVRFSQNGIHYTICNFHGHWKPHTNKEDLPERIEQSQKIVEFLKPEKSKKILCGDFNLAPHTQSIRILEDGMRNLVKEYGITSTRSHYYTKDGKFADYILVSPEVEVKDFKVLPDVVSDHLPLYLEFT